MKITSAKNIIIGKKEWQLIGYRSGWFKRAFGESDFSEINPYYAEVIDRDVNNILDILRSFSNQEYSVYYKKNDNTYRWIHCRTKLNSGATGSFFVFDIDREKALGVDPENEQTIRQIKPINIQIIKRGGSVWLINPSSHPEIEKLIKQNKYLKLDLNSFPFGANL